MTAILPFDPRTRLANSKTTHALITLGKEAGWVFAILGVAPLPHKPIQLSQWRIVPAHMDGSPIPERALERIQAIFAAGLRPKGFLVVHELPQGLPVTVISSDVIDGEFREVKPYELTIDITSILETGMKLGIAFAKLTANAVIVAGGVVLPAIFAMGSALLLDPILVAVTEDDVWVEIDRWWE